MMPAAIPQSIPAIEIAFGVMPRRVSQRAIRSEVFQPRDASGRRSPI
jgi:hypothetical protein